MTDQYWRQNAKAERALRVEKPKWGTHRTVRRCEGCGVRFERMELLVVEGMTLCFECADRAETERTD